MGEVNPTKIGITPYWRQRQVRWCPHGEKARRRFADVVIMQIEGFNVKRLEDEGLA